jgi:outer membrane protein
MNRSSLYLTLAICVLATPMAAFADSRVQGDWDDESRFQLRLRTIGILADGEGRVSQNGLETDVGDAVTLEIDLTYFFTDNIAAELIAATAQH